MRRNQPGDVPMSDLGKLPRPLCILHLHLFNKQCTFEAKFVQNYKIEFKKKCENLSIIFNCVSQSFYKVLILYLKIKLLQISLEQLFNLIIKRKQFICIKKINKDNKIYDPKHI